MVKNKGDNSSTTTYNPRSTESVYSLQNKIMFSFNKTIILFLA